MKGQTNMTQREARETLELELEEIAAELELEESGQVRLGVEGDQIALEGFAAPLEPAPLNHTPERTADELLELWRPVIELDKARTVSAELELERAATKPVEARTGPRRYLCAACGRELKPDEWIYSRHTASRYCPPTDPRGCNTPRAYARAEKARARKA